MVTNNAINLKDSGIAKYDGAGTFSAVTVTQHSPLVGAASNGISSLGPMINGEILIGSTGNAPSVSTLTAGSGIDITNAAGSVTISADGTFAQQNIIYVGKHGNDANDGKNINNAKLTFGSAITAAFAIAPATVVCLDAGTYTENLTGQTGVDIYAPNATISGNHTCVGDWNSWTFGYATSAAGTCFSVTSAINFRIKIGKMTLPDAVSGFSASNGGSIFAIVWYVTFSTGDVFYLNSTAEIQFTVNKCLATSTGSFINAVAAGTVTGFIEAYSDSAFNTSTFIESSAASWIYISSNYIVAKNISNISSKDEIRVISQRLDGSLLELGALTIEKTLGGFRIVDATAATYTMVARNEYITNKAAGVTYTLPAKGAYGDKIKITGKTGLASIAQNANQQICLGDTASTVGVGGSVTATDAGDCMELSCITEGASTVWRATSWIGNWLVT